MSIQVREDDTTAYLFLLGINPKRAIRLTEYLTVEPAQCHPGPDDMISAIMSRENGGCLEVDLRILIATLRQTNAQLLIEGSDAKQLAIRTWNAQTDITLLSALLGEEIYWHIQCDTKAEEFSKNSHVNIVVNSQLYMPREIRMVDDHGCIWLENCFPTARKLMDEEKRFYPVVNSLWALRMNVNPFVQMSVLWAGIESLIGVGSYELEYRISTMAALFLESGAEERNRIKSCITLDQKPFTRVTQKP